MARCSLRRPCCAALSERSVAVCGSIIEQHQHQSVPIAFHFDGTHYSPHDANRCSPSHTALDPLSAHQNDDDRSRQIILRLSFGITCAPLCTVPEMLLACARSADSACLCCRSAMVLAKAPYILASNAYFQLAHSVQCVPLPCSNCQCS